MKKVLTFLLSAAFFMSYAQESISTKGTAVTQNFNSLNATGTASFTNNSTLKGWYLWKTNPYQALPDVLADSGTLSSGRVYSLGNGGSTERAMGSLASGSTDRVCYGWRLKNTTGTAIDRLEISYYGEQWRVAGTADNRLWFYYKIDSQIDSLTYNELKFANGMTPRTKLDFVSPVLGTSAKALNGNDTANRRLMKDTLNISLPANYEIFMVWIDSNDVGSDNMLAIDDISVTALNSSDVTPPSVKSASVLSQTQIEVVYSEGVTRSSAQNTANYNLSPSATISAASLDSATNTVTLTTSLTASVNYTLTVSNIEDLATPANKLVSDSVKNLMYNPYSSTLTVVSATAKAIDTTVIVFNENVTKASAENTANYSFTPAVTVTSVMYDSASKTAMVTGKLTSGKKHSVTVSNVSDLGSPAKIINPATKTGLLFNNYSGTGIVISEISYNDRTGPDDYEFVEIYNNSTAAIEMGGISFSQGLVYMFDEYSLPSKKTVVIAKFADTIARAFGVTPLGSFTSGGLNNSGEPLELVNSKNEVLDFVNYDDASPWDVSADGAGPSLQLRSSRLNNADNDNGANWVVDYRSFGIMANNDTLWATPGSVPVNYVPIEEVRREDANGVNAANGSKVELHGVVYGINMRAGTTGMQFTIRDETGGIGTFNNPKTFGYTVTEGDSVHIIGSINQFRGLSQIELFDTIFKVASGIALNEPRVITQMKESDESDLVKILGFTLLTADAVWGANKNYVATNGTDTLEVRIDSDTDIDGVSIPTGPLDITGIVGQFDASSPFTSGYQLFPRYIGDISQSGGGPAPSIYFASAAASVAENAGTYDVVVKISNPNVNATNFTLSRKGGTAPAADYTATLPANLSFTPASSQDVVFTINLNDNFMVDGSRTLELMLTNADNKATYEADSVFTLTITDNEIATSPISALRANNADGVPNLQGTKVKATGVVHGVDMRGGTGLQFTLIDKTGGVGVFTPAAEFGYMVKEGDSISVQGNLGFFNGLTQIDFLDTIIFHASGKMVMSPVKVSMLDETSESNVVLLEKVWFVSDTVTVWPSNGNIAVTNGTTTFDVRIDRDVTDVAGMAVPAYDTLNIAGIGGQFDASSPYTEGYQLLPRYMADITQWKPATGFAGQLAVKVSMYPNPTAGLVSVLASEPVHTYNVYSLTGQILLSGRFTGTIDLSNLNKGVYIVELISNNATGKSRVVKH